MVSSNYEVHLNVPIYDIWFFLSDMNKWAPLVPGYRTHEEISDKKSIWTCGSKRGVVHKTLQLEVHITEWIEPSKISFNMKGINEKIEGNGYFQAEEIHDQETKVIGSLRMKAKGMMAPMINSVIKVMLPAVIEEFTNDVADEINKRQTARANA